MYLNFYKENIDKTRKYLYTKNRSKINLWLYHTKGLIDMF